MWQKSYKDYPSDDRFHKKERKNIVGCEMNELYGWGEKQHIPPEKPTIFKKFLKRFKKKA